MEDGEEGGEWADAVPCRVKDQGISGFGRQRVLALLLSLTDGDDGCGGVSSGVRVRWRR
jgi:hypothetical protein